MLMEILILSPVVIFLMFIINRIISIKKKINNSLIEEYLFKKALDTLTLYEVKNNKSAIYSEDKVDEYGEWFNSIKYLLGRDISLSGLRDGFNDYFDKLLNNIRILSNIAPAIGLISTFAGLFFIMFNMDTDKLDFDVSGFYVLIVGSIIAMLVYIWGNWIYKNLVGKVHENVENYLSLYVNSEKSIHESKIQGLHDIYANLQEPLSELLGTFNKVKKSFSKFDDNYLNHVNQFKNLVNKHSSNTESELNNIRSFFDENISKLNLILTENYENNASTISSLSENVKAIEGFKETIKALEDHLGRGVDSLEKFSTATGSTERIIKDISDILNQLSTHSNSLSDAEKALLNNKLSIDELIKIYDKYTIEVQENLKDISSFNEKIDSLSNSILSLDLSPLNRLQNFKIEYFSDAINKSNSKILEKLDKITNSLEKRSYKGEISASFDYDKLSEILEKKISDSLGHNNDSFFRSVFRDSLSVVIPVSLLATIYFVVTNNEVVMSLIK